MSTTVTYKNNTLTTVSNATKTLKTAGKYMEGDVTLVDDSKPTHTDVENDAGGRTITINDGVITTNSKTVRLIPTKIYRVDPSDLVVDNESGLLTNTDSNTYATIYPQASWSPYVFVGGFDLSGIPKNSVSNYSVKFKSSNTSNISSSSTKIVYNGDNVVDDQSSLQYTLYNFAYVNRFDNPIS